MTKEQLAAREAEVKALVEQNKRDEAGKILFQLIEACARKGDINNANRLRDMFYDVDPMALTSIIKANEIIEEAMNSSISDDFTKAWSGLKETLTDDEYMAFYHSLQKHELEKGKVIVKAGSRLDALFLVNKGNINVYCNCLGKNVEVKTLEPGSMIGENCFHPTVWTCSLVTSTNAELYVLRQKQLSELIDKFPGFENKLINYYKQFDNIEALLKDKGHKRRKYERFLVDQKMVFHMMEKDGKPSDRAFRGQLDNISQGGLAFLMRIVKRENRWQLLGRSLLISVDFEGGPLRFKGNVTAISMQDLQNHDYSIHVAFDESIAESVITPLIPPEEEEMELPEEAPGESGEIAIDLPGTEGEKQ